MKLLSFAPLFVTVVLLSACESPDSWQVQSTGAGGGGNKEVYDNQDRNGPCWKTSDCMDDLICKGATKESPGACSLDCGEDRDCGNGFLCRDGSCQRDCAGVGEKCSPRRVCCFQDEDDDGKTDSACTDEAGDMRCRI